MVGFEIAIAGTIPTPGIAMYGATKKSFLWAYDNMAETAQLHAKANPEVDADDALGSLRIFLARYASRPEHCRTYDCRDDDPDEWQARAHCDLARHRKIEGLRPRA